MNVMNSELWHIILSVGPKVRALLDQNLSDYRTADAADRTVARMTSPEMLQRLRGDIRTRLDEIKEALGKHLSEKEGFQVLFPLVLHADELVTRRLSRDEQTMWSLLQLELFDINDGGDVLYSYIDERLADPKTPPLVFQVLYFILSDGFIGRFGPDPGRITLYKAKLAERIPADVSEPVEKRRRPRGEPEPIASSSSFIYYAATLLFGVLIAAALIGVTNL